MIGCAGVASLTLVCDVVQVVKIPRTSKWREQRPAIREAIMAWLAGHDTAFAQATATAVAAGSEGGGKEPATASGETSGSSECVGEKLEEAKGERGSSDLDSDTERAEAVSPQTTAPVEAVKQFRRLWKRGKLPHLCVVSV